MASVYGEFSVLQHENQSSEKEEQEEDVLFLYVAVIIVVTYLVHPGQLLPPLII